MRTIDFSSWYGLLSTLIGLALFALIGIGLRLLLMLTIQQRRERMNRQINERLKTLIAAYKALGGSFTGNLAVSPEHLRDMRHRKAVDTTVDTRPAKTADDGGSIDSLPETSTGSSDRARRIRDAVEAALADIILLGTEEHVRLAERAARELVAGREVHIDELVVSLRNYIRKALDLDPIPNDLQIPKQGPLRPASSGGRGRTGGDRLGRGVQSGAGGGGASGNSALGLAAGENNEAPPA